jgi:hypothetical protein
VTGKTEERRLPVLLKKKMLVVLVAKVVVAQLLEFIFIQAVALGRIAGFKFCGSGYNLVGSTPNFPEAGNSSIWQCVSTGRSSNYPITCSAAKRNNSAEMVACGSNATEYEKGTVGWLDQQGSAFCRLGNLSISGYIPMFPTEDQRARSWECESKTNNIDGKKETRKCTATLKDQEGNAPIVGRCGSATTKDYPSVTTEIPNQDLCLSGNPNWQVAFGGENGDQVSWTCKGSALQSDSGLCQTRRITSGGIDGDGEETGVEDEEGGNNGGSLACVTNPNVSINQVILMENSV